MGFPPFDANELAGLREAQEAAMQDRCRILAHGYGAPDRYRRRQAMWTPGVEEPCGFRVLSPRERLDGTQVADAEVQFRFPVARAEALANQLNRIELTQRYGEAITPELYELVGAPARGPSGLVVYAKRVIDPETR